MQPERLIGFCDGAAEPTNPGPMGAGYVLLNEGGRQLEAKGFYLGHGTNNFAEYTAVVKAIEAAIRRGAARLDLRTDSELVVKQINGEWATHKDHLRELRKQALDAFNQIPAWSIEWVPRERNERADVCAVNAATFKRDVDYSDKQILRTRSERIRSAVRDYCGQRPGRESSRGSTRQYRCRDYERTGVVRRFGQWCVTVAGIENTHGPVDYQLDRCTLADPLLTEHMAAKRWVVRDDFNAALDFARKHFGASVSNPKNCEENWNRKQR